MSGSKQGMSEALLLVADMMEGVIAATAGYRAQLETAGFSPTAAEAMAMSYHEALLSAAFSGVGK